MYIYNYLYLIKHLQRRFKDSFISQTEKLNKHNTEGYRTQIFFQDAKNETVQLYT